MKLLLNFLDFLVYQFLESRTKTTVRKIVKKDQKFNSSISWIDYKKKDRKEDSKGNDQMSNNCYSTPLSDLGPIPDNLDALAWDEDTNIFNFWDNIPELNMHDA